MKEQTDFVWDSGKNLMNQRKHGVSISVAQHAFLDHNRTILEDIEHSSDEKRYYCLGKVAGESLTVRFTYRF